MNQFNPQRYLRSLGFKERKWGTALLFEYINGEEVYTVQFEYGLNEGVTNYKYWLVSDNKTSKLDDEFKAAVNNLFHSMYHDLKHRKADYRIDLATSYRTANPDYDYNTMEGWNELFCDLEWDIVNGNV